MSRACRPDPRAFGLDKGVWATRLASVTPPPRLKLARRSTPGPASRAAAGSPVSSRPPPPASSAAAPSVRLPAPQPRSPTSQHPCPPPVPPPSSIGPPPSPPACFRPRPSVPAPPRPVPASTQPRLSPACRPAFGLQVEQRVSTTLATPCFTHSEPRSPCGLEIAEPVHAFLSTQPLWLGDH